MVQRLMSVVQMIEGYRETLQRMVPALIGYADLMALHDPRAADLLRVLADQLSDKTGSLDARGLEPDPIPPRPDPDRLRPSVAAND
jgi:hypothetical protein